MRYAYQERRQIAKALDLIQLLCVRPWVFGATLIAFGACSHIALDPPPGRIEMGQFACFEFVLYGVGHFLILVSLLSAPMAFGWRASLAALWLAGA